MRGVGHEAADVVEQACCLQQLAVGDGQPVRGSGLVEQLQGQVGGVFGVDQVLVVAAGQGQHAGASEVAEVVQPVVAGAVPAVEAVEQQPLAQRSGRHHQRFDAEGLEQLPQKDGPRHDHVAAGGVQAGHSGTLAGRGPGNEVGYNLIEVGALDGGVGYGAQSLTAAGRAESGHRRDSARTAHCDIEADCASLPGHVGHERLDMAPAGLDRAVGDHAAVEEAVGEPDVAQLEAAGQRPRGRSRPRSTRWSHRPMSMTM